MLTSEISKKKKEEKKKDHLSVIGFKTVKTILIFSA